MMPFSESIRLYTQHSGDLNREGCAQAVGGCPTSPERAVVEAIILSVQEHDVQQNLSLWIDESSTHASSAALRQTPSNLRSIPCRINAWQWRCIQRENRFNSSESRKFCRLQTALNKTKMHTTSFISRDSLRTRLKEVYALSKHPCFCVCNKALLPRFCS